MQNKYLNILKGIIIAAIMVALPTVVFAQDPPGPGGDPDAPIDGGLSLLLAAGIGYGAKKVRDARKGKKESRDK